MLDLRLTRRPSTAVCTIGVLEDVSDPHAPEFLCYTLEDVVREQSGQAISQWKIPGSTAIPLGKYRVIVTMSTRFKRYLPLLTQVPGFDAIRIHGGNTAEDTEGCILVAMRDGVDEVLDSQKALTTLVYPRIERALLAGELVWIAIRPPKL